MSKDKIILDYHNSILYNSDLLLLDYPNWINDRLIGFVYEFFEYEKYENLKDHVAFVNPSVLQLIKLDGDFNEVIACFLEPLDLKSKMYILLPINDNNDPNRMGGSHWSLLLINRLQSQFTHYDSFHKTNSVIARKLFEKLNAYFECNQYNDEPKCPQQTNTCDCGLYVISISESISDCVTNGMNVDQVDLNAITPAYVNERRQFYKDLIFKIDSASNMRR